MDNISLLVDNTALLGMISALMLQELLTCRWAKFEPLLGLL